MVGLTICCVGEVVRKIAILTASSNFNHLVSIYYLIIWKQCFIFINSGARCKSRRSRSCNGRHF